MKKQINSVNSWSVKSIITVTILSAMLCTFSAKAYDKPSAAINTINVNIKSESETEGLMNNDALTKIEAAQYNAEEFAEDELAYETECYLLGDDWMDSVTEQYNAENFVETDMALETENWVNSNSETNSEPILVGEYNATDFVDADMALETDNWMNNNGL
jgi:hypothetical protein